MILFVLTATASLNINCMIQALQTWSCQSGFLTLAYCKSVIISSARWVSLPAPSFSSMGIWKTSPSKLKEATGLTIAAVPAPKASYIRFSLTALIRSYILKSLTETLNSPRSCMTFSRLFRVIPGRIVPSSGGVTSSFSPYSFFQ